MIKLKKLSPGIGIPYPTYVKIEFIPELVFEDNGKIYLSPEIACESEVDLFVDALIAQLENVRLEAKKHFRSKR